MRLIFTNCIDDSECLITDLLPKLTLNKSKHSLHTHSGVVGVTTPIFTGLPGVHRKSLRGCRSLIFVVFQGYWRYNCYIDIIVFY